MIDYALAQLVFSGLGMLLGFDEATLRIYWSRGLLPITGRRRDCSCSRFLYGLETYRRNSLNPALPRPGSLCFGSEQSGVSPDVIQEQSELFPPALLSDMHCAARNPVHGLWPTGNVTLFEALDLVSSQALVIILCSP